MADAGIKKYRQEPIDLPPISSENEGYTLRYRIISEDRNRVSHWSPVYLVIPNFTYVPGQINFNTGNQIATFTWDAVTILKDTKTVQAISNKQLTSDIATLTTDGAHYMLVGDWVTVEGVDSTFNGTYKISAVTTNTFSYYKDHGNIGSSAVSPEGTYKTNAFIRNALEYDIWVRWDRNDGGDWLYKERIESTTLSLPYPDTYTINGAIQPSSPNRVSIEVYLVGEPVVREDGIPLDTSTPFLKMYQLLNETI
jgi:hypothetical protein